MTQPRGALQSDYMHWAKHQRRVRFPLSASEVPHFRMDRLPITLADLDLDGASHHRYPPMLEAIAARYGVGADQVVTGDGTSMANFLAMAALIAPGDEAVFETPAYEPMLAAARFLGATIRSFVRDPEAGFAVDPARVAAAVTDRTRLIVLANLHNPSSARTDEATLAAVGEVAERVDAHVLVDEVYLDAASTPQRSAVHLGPRFVCTNSLTKVYGLSGLRSGWVLAAPELVERMVRLNDLFGVNQAHPAERLACLAFAHLDTIVGDTPAMLARNRGRFDAFVADRPELECMPACDGITVFPRLLRGDPDRLDALLRERYEVSIVPGRWFDHPDRFRIGLGLPPEVFDEALERLAAGLDALTDA